MGTQPVLNVKLQAFNVMLMRETVPPLLIGFIFT